MKKIIVILMAILLSVAVAGCSSNGSSDNAGHNNKEDKPTLTFGVTNWTSTVPPTKIAEHILKDMGYEVKEKTAEPGAVYAGMSEGDVDVFMDSWYPNQKQYIDKYSDSIKSISVSYDDADSGMVVPKYMKDINDVKDLKGKEDLVDHKMYGIGSGDPAMDNMKKMIKGYGLDIELVTSSESAMLAAAEDKIDKKEPVLFYGWRPHSMFQQHDLKILTNKKYSDKFFGGSSVHVIANKKLKDKAPEAYKFLSEWSISIDDLEEMIDKIDDDEDPDDVAQEWIDDHQDKVDEMKGKK